MAERTSGRLKGGAGDGAASISGGLPVRRDQSPSNRFDLMWRGGFGKISDLSRLLFLDKGGD